METASSVRGSFDVDEDRALLRRLLLCGHGFAAAGVLQVTCSPAVSARHRARGGGRELQVACGSSVLGSYFYGLHAFCATLAINLGERGLAA